MPRKDKYISKSLAGGFKLSFKHFLFILAYWSVLTAIFLVLISPVSAGVNNISGASDISADIEKSRDISGYFLIDILPAFGKGIFSSLNSTVLLLFGLSAFAAGAFFNGAFLESFRRMLKASASAKPRSMKDDRGQTASFIRGGTRHFLTMLMFFLLGATCFFLLNTLTSSAGRFLKAVAWGMTGSEAAEYYTGLAVRAVYYILFFYLALILQYARIAAVFGDEPAKKVRLRPVINFKDGLSRGYDFLSDNKLKAACLFLIILAMTVAWFVMDHLVFFHLTESASLDPLVWSAFTGFGYIFFRVFQYSVAAAFFHFRSSE